MRTWRWLPLCSLFLGCGQDPTVVVARIGQESTGTAPFACTSERTVGPEGYQWCRYATAGGVTNWFGDPPTEQRLAFTAEAPKDVRAGVAFQFDTAASLRDLAPFSQVALDLDVDVGEGDKFELFLGQGPDLGCSYVFKNVGQGSTPGPGTYTMDLGAPDWCMPSQCGFDLKASGGMLLAHVPTDSVLNAAVTGVRFELGKSADGGAAVDGIAAGRARAYGAALGPGGFCWFRVDWNGAIVDTSYGSTGSVSVCAIARDDEPSASVSDPSAETLKQVGGLAFELPNGEFKLSEFKYLDVTAAVYVSAPPSRTGTGGAGGSAGAGGTGGAGDAGGTGGASGATGASDSMMVCALKEPCGISTDNETPSPACVGLVGSPFKIQGVNGTRGLVWEPTALGEPRGQDNLTTVLPTYRIDLHDKNVVSFQGADEDPLTLDEVLRFEIVVGGGDPGTLNATITNVKFVEE